MNSSSTGGRRTFSLKAMMIAVTCTAILLAMPSMLRRALLAMVWYVVPALLVTMAVQGRRDVRCFGMGALASYVALSLGSARSGLIDSELIKMVTILVAGGASRWLCRRLGSDLPVPPPKPASVAAAKPTSAPANKNVPPRRPPS